jgi:hypothetical protein
LGLNNKLRGEREERKVVGKKFEKNVVIIYWA